MNAPRLGAELLKVLCCPRCAAQLSSDDSLTCVACGTAYGLLGALPCLLAEPAFWRASMRRRLDEYLDFSGARLAALEAEQRDPALPLRTRLRLSRIVDGMHAERSLVERVLAPLRVGRIGLPAAGALSASHGAGAVELLHCYEHVFRDWCWGQAEANASLQFLARLVEQAGASGRLGTVAVFGAGAGRLAADVHQELGPTRTIALDLNPLPLLVAEELVRGAALEASEFPVAPRDGDSVAVARRLVCPYVARAGLSYVLGDGLQPPLAAESIDTVITPWYIDVVDAEPRVTFAAINHVLKPGGTWLNFGPLRFSGATARLYSIEEVHDLAEEHGFLLAARISERQPYFRMPESGAHREELVYGFAARKRRAVSHIATTPAEPAWLLNPTLPVPQLPEWQTLQRTAVLAGALMDLVDGQRSIADMSNELGPRWGMDPRLVDPELQAFLARFLAR